MQAPYVRATYAPWATYAATTPGASYAPGYAPAEWFATHERQRGLLFDLNLDTAVIAKIEERFAGMEGAAKRIISKALNAGLLKMRSALIVAASRETGIPERVIRERVWKRPSRITSLYARARGGKVGWPLDRFPYSRTPHGIHVDVPGGGFDVPSAFVATMPEGHTGVYRRKANWRWKPVSAPKGIMVGGERVSGLPIFKVRTDSVTSAVMRLSQERDFLEQGRTEAMAVLNASAESVLSGGKG